jgi:hypothetical protein
MRVFVYLDNSAVVNEPRQEELSQHDLRDILNIWNARLDFSRKDGGIARYDGCIEYHLVSLFRKKAGEK